MTITEILRYYQIENIAPYEPFILKSLPSRITTPQWWIDIGGEDLTNTRTVNITAIINSLTTELIQENTFANMQGEVNSFYFNNATQELYIHLDAELLPSITDIEQGQTDGYTDKTAVYIDDVFYQPLLKSVPSLAKKADLANYNKMAFLSGSITFDNTEGNFDDIIDNNIYGNNVSVFYLADDEDTSRYTRSELIALATFYVENYKHTLKEFVITAQDKRKAQNVNILDDDEVPRIYGTIKNYKPKTIDDTLASPRFQLGYNLTDIGTVEVEGDYGWVPATPFDIDYTNGTFRISYISVRRNSEIDGTILPVRVREFTGMAIDSALDIIVDLNGLDYNSNNYDLTQWAIAKGAISAVGVVFDEQQEVYDAIQKIQNGCNVGFRYDITAEGKRTILLDDFNKAVSNTITFYDIQNNLTQPVSTNSDLLAAIVNIKYNKDYIDDDYTSHVDDSKAIEVLKAYRQQPTLTIETFLTSEAKAIERASFTLERYSTIERTAELTILGSQYFSLELYDIIELELSIDRQRTYFGKWKAQIISVSPDTTKGVNKISALIVERL